MLLGFDARLLNATSLACNASAMFSPTGYLLPTAALLAADASNASLGATDHRSKLAETVLTWPVDPWSGPTDLFNVQVDGPGSDNIDSLVVYTDVRRMGGRYPYMSSSRQV